MTLFDFSVITIGPGEFASVQLTQKVYQFDPTVTFCVSERFQLAYVPPEKSNQFLCMQECQVNATIQFCGCAVVFPNSNLPENVRCDPLVSRQCFGLSRIIYNLTYRKFITNCQAVNCPTECESRLYKASVVYSRAKQPNRTNDPDLITSAINIYFSELQYTLVSEANKNSSVQTF